MSLPPSLAARGTAMPADLKRLRRVCAIPSKPDLELAALGGTRYDSSPGGHAAGETQDPSAAGVRHAEHLRWEALSLRSEAERLCEIATRLEAIADSIAADFQTGKPEAVSRPRLGPLVSKQVVHGRASSDQ